MKKILYIVTAFNLLCQIVWLTVGSMSNPGILIYLFRVFHPLYVLASGFVALIMVCIITAGIFVRVRKLKDVGKCDIIILVLNVEYIAYYSWLMGRM